MLQARHQVPEVVLQQIRSLNHLDLELYKYAKNIFAKQHGRTMHKFHNTVSLPLSQTSYIQNIFFSA